MAEYIVLKIGIFFSKSLNNCKNFLPIKDNDKPPTKVIKITDSKISKPGIANGR